MSSIFGSDRVLLYDVLPWNTLGFGVPNFGENIGTLSMPIAGLVDEIGAGQLLIMTHIDAMRKQPPGPNTVRRIGKIVNRIHQVLLGRQKQYSDLRLEPGHSTPAVEIWNIHPAPYFKGPVVRNRWLLEYNRLTMIGLANLMQHSDNNLALTVTSKLSSDCWQYFNEIKMLLGAELLNIKIEDLKKDDFQFNEEHYSVYNPEGVTLNFESLDYPGPLFSLPTEDDLKPLFDGIPANLIMPMLKQYPVLQPGGTGQAGPVIMPGTGVPGTSGALPQTGPVINPPVV